MGDEVRVKKAEKKDDAALLFNPLLTALKENDKKNLFKTNVNTAFIKTGFPLIDYYFGAVVNVHDDKGNLTGQEARVGQAAGTFNLIIGSSGTGKEQPNSTPIPTPHGWTTMGELKPGDEVFTITGKVVKVKEIYPQGVKDVYQITFSDGRTALCGYEHLWKVMADSEPLIVYSTGQMLSDYKHFDDPEDKYRKYCIQLLTHPVEYEERAIPASTHSIAAGIRNGGNEIPDEYVHNSVEIRVKILLDLFSEVGWLHISGVNYTVMMSTTSEKAIYQIQEIIRSLGFNADVVRSDEIPHWNLVFKVPKDVKKILFNKNCKTSLEKRICRFLKKEHVEVIWIDDIQLVGQEESTCIYIDHPSHMYITDQFIPTHNTTLAAQIAGNIIHQFPYANVIHFDCENRFDVSRAETITKLPPKDFAEGSERYMIKNGMVGLDIIQKMITDIYKEKMKLKDQLMVDTGLKDEFGKPVMMIQPTIIIIDSITTVMTETFSPDNTKDMKEAEKLRSNTEGARDAKTMKGFFKDVLPLCKEANIIIYGINHINTNMSMNSILPVAKQQNFLGQNESIPGGRTMIYYPYNIIKLIPKVNKDDRFEEAVDGFNGHLVRVEPIKSSSNQSGNGSANGLAFDLVFNVKQGFDPLRSMILYGKNNGIIEGNRNRMKFKDDPSFTFTFKDIYKEKDKYPIWKNIVKYIIPHLDKKLSYTEPSEIKFDEESLQY